MTGLFNERDFKIHQQGTRETELAGNVSVDLDIEVPVDESLITTFTNLYNDLNLPNKADTVKMNHIRYRFPDISKLSNGIKGNLKYDFVVRHIRKNAETYPEFDDRINFIVGKNSTTVTLIKKEDLIIPIYFIKINLNNNPLSLTFAENDQVIQFISYTDAKEFQNWLMHTIKTLNTNNLIINGEKISFQGLSVLNESVKTNLKEINVDLYK